MPVAVGPSPEAVEGFDVEASEFARLCAGEDMREGVSAFLQERSPIFRDH